MRTSISRAAAVIALAAPLYGELVTTTYEYDAVGNRITASGLIRFTDVGVFSFHPPRAVPGERVNIFGRNLPPGDGRELAVTFSGVAAAIVSVAPSVVTVEVPSGAGSGPLVVTLPDSSQVDLGTFYVQGIILSPSEAKITHAQAVQFTAEVIGAVDPSVTWEVLVPFGEDADGDPGAITTEGLYTPPAISEDVLALPQAWVKVTSVELPYLSAVAFVQLWGTSPHVGGSTALVPGSGGLGGSPTILGSEPAMVVLVPDPAGPLAADVTSGSAPIVLLAPIPDGMGPPSPVVVSDPPVDVEFEESDP